MESGKESRLEFLQTLSAALLILALLVLVMLAALPASDTSEYHHVERAACSPDKSHSQPPSNREIGGEC
jgi:hypothetical protein